MSETDYESLRPFCTTTRQSEVLDALAKHGSQRKASVALGVTFRNVTALIERLRRTAALRGFSPDHDLTHPVAPGQKLRGASTLYDADGNLVQQWVKSAFDAEAFDRMAREIIAAMSSDIKREKPVKAPKATEADLLNLYPITDYHMGMLAWGEETGADWDTEIAEELLVRWFAHAIESSPPAQVGILGQLGDFLHWDGMKAVTPEGGFVLDADTRFEKLVRVAIRVLRRVVRMLLEKHERLHIVMAEGNHDPASSVWLREWFAALYENEPRVTVDQSPDPYYCYEHGQTSLFFHHGHKRGMKSVDEVLTAKFRDVFGRTKHSYAHVGHCHDSQVKESPLMIVEQHRTLASADAFASRGGFLSGRGASVITYSKQFGEVGRVVIGPDMCAA